ncbi:MAG: hypothetical protein WCN21_05505 [Comamonadaceae bacterium]
MSVIRLSGFGGENRALHPMLLPETIGVVSLNQKPGRGDLRPWKAPASVTTVPSGRQTIYRMGRDVVSDTQYWLSWTSEVHVVCAPSAADTAQRTYFSGGSAFAPRWTDTTLALASIPYPTAYRELGVPAPATACVLSATGGTSTLSETRYYSYTYVSDIGEESAPNPSPTEIVCKSDDTITISALAAPPSGAYGIDRMRIYRTQSGQGGDAAFFFVREIASTLRSTTDDGRSLQETLPSTTWLMPPSDLSWLTGLWNGMMAGISGRSVRFCEAYTYYAWPIAYEILPTNAQPVALATYGQTLVMLTNGNPSIITGGTPDAMDEQPVEFCQACIAPLSAVGMGHGVAWASPDGLAYIGTGGARMLTEGVMTRDDWQAINPSSIKACMVERRYLASYSVDGVRKGFVLDPANPGGMYFLDFGFDALYQDDLQDALFVLDGSNVQKWDSGASKTVSFTSKLFRSPKPTVGFACAQVVAESYPLTFKLYADTVLRHTQTVASREPFRLPGGYYGTDFQIQVETTGAVQGVALAHSMRELAQTV